MVDKLFELYYKLVHRNEEIKQTIEEQQKFIDELQTVLKFRTNENKSLYKEINRLRIEIKDSDRELIELVKENTTLKNDYKKCYAENVRLSEENNQLKLRIKMLTKIGFNSIYGIHWCKNHWVYDDTDSIKSESVEE